MTEATTVAPETTETEAPAETWKGQNVPRKEDKRLVQGQGVFVDDIKRHGMGFIHFVRSPYAHAHITSLDVSKAGDGARRLRDADRRGGRVADRSVLPDLVGAGREPEGLRARGRQGALRRRGRSSPSSPRRASSRATRPSSSRSNTSRSTRSPTRATRASDGVPTIHEDAGGNLMWEGVYEWGDLDAAFAEADKIVKIDELHFHRFNSTPLECDGALVEYNRGTGQWTIHTNNQFPGFAAIMMGPAMRSGLDKLRFVTQDIGGGFGNKITSHPQLVVCCLLARKLHRPVQWTEWRTDFHMSMSHGNERWFQDTEVAVKTDGTLLGFRTKALDDAGAWLRYEPLGGVIWAQVTPGHVPLAAHPASSSRRSRRTRRPCRRTAATRACSTSGSPSA